MKDAANVDLCGERRVSVEYAIQATATHCDWRCQFASVSPAMTRVDGQRRLSWSCRLFHVWLSKGSVLATEPVKRCKACLGSDKDKG